MRTGEVVWDAGNSFERLAVAYGVHNNDRAANKGAEPEGLAIAEFDGTRYAFVGSASARTSSPCTTSATRRSPSSCRPCSPRNGPEGILPIPGRDLLVVSSEEDEAAVGVRAAVNVYEFGPGASDQFPSIVSDSVDGEADRLAGSRRALRRPGVRRRALRRERCRGAAEQHLLDRRDRLAGADHRRARRDAGGGTPANLDVEGMFARRQGGFWLAVEGANGAGNALVRTDAAGAIVQSTPLPVDIAGAHRQVGPRGRHRDHGAAGGENVYVAVQRPLWTDPAAASGPIDGDGVTRIGRYDVTTGAWTWFGYRLEGTSTPR